MRQSMSSGRQVTSTPEKKRLRELEQENDLLKLLYMDLLQKFSAMKEGFIRSEGIC